MPWNNRKADRVSFSRGLPVQVVAVDGTWHRCCTLLDISATGARLRVDQSIEGFDLKEFFLQLSSTGLAFRHCELIWVNGDEIGAKFVAEISKKSRSLYTESHGVLKSCN